MLADKLLAVARDVDDLRTDWRDSEFIAECLCWHNVYRQRHDSPPLTMSPRLCEYAQTWANHLAHTDAFYYRNDRDVGQNLYCRPGGAVPTDVTGQDVASYWYSAVQRYDFSEEPDVLRANVNAGHFTQLVWAGSRYFGVGKARGRTGKIVVVANYRPVGNVSGQFRTNVLPPLPDNNAPPPPPPSPPPPLLSSPPPSLPQPRPLPPPSPPSPPLRRSSSKIFRDKRCCVSSDSSPPPPPPPQRPPISSSSSSMRLADAASMDGARSSVASTR